MRLLAALAAVSMAALAQNPCQNTPAYSPCEISFELTPAEAAAHPDPYKDVELQAELRSPHFRTYLMPAFLAGDRKFIIRFAPAEAGQWTYRITSNVPRFEAKEASFTAAESASPGYVRPANVHHWQTDDRKPHLWMGVTWDRLGFDSTEDISEHMAAIEAAKYNHVRVNVLGGPAERPRVFAGNRPAGAYFDELDRRILDLHRRGITTDLVLASSAEYLAALLPDWQSRERFVRYLVARYAALNLTWGGVLEWEDFPDARALLKEIGLAIRKLDPYDHPRSSNGKVTSSPLLPDGWMNFVITSSEDDQLGAVEHQLYAVPFVGVTSAAHLWNCTMNGQYPELRDDVPGIAKPWFTLMSDTRHWELEPFFDLDNARGVALEGIEYIVYVERPAPLEINVERHGYDVLWLDPASGATQEEKKYKGEHFTGAPPNGSHPWVLMIAREGRKESMLRSWKFESRPVPVQELETSVQKIPFDIAAPSGDTLKAASPVPYSAKLKRETRATRSMMYLWTAEVPAEGRGFRVLGTGASGAFRIPPVLARSYPAVLSIHLTALNANGKAYSLDKVYQLAK